MGLCNLSAAGQQVQWHTHDDGRSTTTVLTAGWLDRAFKVLVQGNGRRNGGFGYAPKFPQRASLQFLLRFRVRSRQKEPLALVHQTLWAMALRGLYDQLGGCNGRAARTVFEVRAE